MKRRDFFGLSAAAMGAGFFLDAAEGSSRVVGAGAELLDSPPVLQCPSEDGMTVGIAVGGLSTAWVEYGETPELGKVAEDLKHGLLPLSSRVHQIRIEGLAPGRTYHYRVAVAPIDFRGPYSIKRGAEARTGVYSFRTLDRSESASFCVINDTHEKVATLEGVTKRLEAAKAGLTFWNGDIFDDVRSDEQIVANIMKPGGSAYAATAPMCFVSGNHDVRGVHCRSLERFAPTPGGKRYHVVRHGPIAFIVLDTGEDKPDGHAVYAGLGAFSRYREAQRAWLESAIETEEVRSARFRVVVQHIPMWHIGGAGAEDCRAKWAGVLAKAKVSAMICGHTHRHEYSGPDGDHGYAQLVGGGPAAESATVIEGRAEGDRLSLIVRDLSGKEIGNHEVRG